MHKAPAAINFSLPLQALELAVQRSAFQHIAQLARIISWTNSQMLRRVLLYGSVLLALCLAMLVSLSMRTPLKVDVVRDRAALARIVAGGQLENVYRLQIMNATEGPQRYRITARGLEGLPIVTDNEVEVGPAEARWVVVRLQLPYGTLPEGSHPVHFDVQALGAKAQVAEKWVFLAPRQ